MFLENLNKKWQTINNCDTVSGFKIMRISSSCVPELYIALDENGFRCLVLFVSGEVKIKLKGSQKKNVSIQYNKDAEAVVIRLCDSNFMELFNDLVISLYNKVKAIVDPQILSHELIGAFYKWVELFEPTYTKKLSQDQVKGLLGELFVLRNFLTDTSVENIDEIMSAWQGPYENSNDFILDSKNIEVKTKMESQSIIRISSEHQLKKEFDKGLELAVVSVKLDLVKGESIYDLIVKIVQILREKLGDLSILYHALNQLGLTVESTIEYNNYRFLVSKISHYDCSKDNFPGLSISNIPKEISKLRYNLRINSLQEFLIQENQY
ncbi:MAG: PD-(D/E)XK motif protein [Marinifilaceae bacterium]